MRYRSEREVAIARDDYEQARSRRWAAWRQCGLDPAAYEEAKIVIDREYLRRWRVTATVDNLLAYLLDGPPTQVAAAFSELVWRFEIDPQPDDVTGLLSRLPPRCCSNTRRPTRTTPRSWRS